MLKIYCFPKKTPENENWSRNEINEIYYISEELKILQEFTIKTYCIKYYN